MEIKIVVDSSSNILELEGVDFASAPLTIVTDNKEYRDDENLDVREMVDDLKAYKGKSGSACPGVGDFIEAFGNADVVFCLTITSALSGSYNAALVAKEQYEEENPGKKAYVIDTLSAGPEVKFTVEKLKDMILSGMDPEEIYTKILEYKTEGTGLVFALASMTNLANNGRVSPAAAKFASMLGIRAVGQLSEQGTLDPKDKCRGEKRAIAGIIKNMEELRYAGGRVRVDHCFALETAEKLAEAIKAKYENAEVIIEETRGLCSFYAELGGLMVAFER